MRHDLQAEWLADIFADQVKRPAAIFLALARQPQTYFHCRQGLLCKRQLFVSDCIRYLQRNHP